MNEPTSQPQFEIPEVTTRPLPGSRRVYTSPAMAPALRVLHCEIDLHHAARAV